MSGLPYVKNTKLELSQDNVRNTLELLRNAGVRVWMLTGDKLETATCIAKSSMLVSKTQAVHIFR